MLRVTLGPLHTWPGGACEHLPNSSPPCIVCKQQISHQQVQCICLAFSKPSIFQKHTHSSCITDKGGVDDAVDDRDGVGAVNEMSINVCHCSGGNTMHLNTVASKGSLPPQQSTHQTRKCHILKAMTMIKPLVLPCQTKYH